MAKFETKIEMISHTHIQAEIVDIVIQIIVPKDGFQYLLEVVVFGEAK